MIKRRWSCILAVALAATSIAANPCAAAPKAPPVPTPAQIGLAQRLESMAYDIADNTPNPSPAIWRQIAALLKASAKLNWTEPRYPRMQFQACESAGDLDGAQGALLSYLSQTPDDQYAQAKLLDLYLGRMQTADSILKYMRSRVSMAALPAPVRAHAAVICAQTFYERSQREEALKMLNSALQIDPLCIPALRMKLSLTSDEGPAHRCGLLIALLRANPLDADTATQLADQLAQLGLPEASAIWYSQAASIYQIANQPRSQELGKGAATELYLCNHATDAAALLDGYLSSVPDDTDAWMIRLAIAQDSPTGQSAFESLSHRGVNMALHGLESIRAAMGDEKAAADVSMINTDADSNPAPLAAAPPTSQPDSLAAPAPVPTTQPLAATPDMSDDIHLLVKINQQKLTDDYINAVGNLAWMRLYFLRDAGPDTQRVIDALAKLIQPDDPLLARLVGWKYLVLGQWPEAKQKLSAVADRDPYAALGMVLIDDQSGDRAGADLAAQRTMALHPSGPVAAVLFSALHGRGAKIMPLPQADLVVQEVQNFPRDWLNIFTQPQQFYTVTAEPLDRSVVFPQAMLARVTIQNVGDYDLTMGDQGTLHPQMVFDAIMRGLIEKQVGQTAFDQIWQRLVLPRGQFTSQIVRLDRGALLKELNAHPDTPIDVQFSVMLNPIQTANNGYVVGPAGCRVPFIAMCERTATSIQTADDRKKLFDVITNGKPQERIRAVEAAGSFYLSLRNAAKGITIDQTLSQAKEMFDHAQAAANDKDPDVKAWADFVGVLITPAQMQDDLVAKMARSGEWYSRLLAVAAAQRTADHGAAASSALSNDTDPIVRDFAQAVSDQLHASAAAP